jgi:hypothetical protein
MFDPAARSPRSRASTALRGSLVSSGSLNRRGLLCRTERTEPRRKIALLAIDERSGKRVNEISIDVQHGKMVDERCGFRATAGANTQIQSLEGFVHA